MILDIDFHSGVPIYRQVVVQVQRLILSGVLAEGHQMESVRDLSGRLKVNPMTISKAYSTLESEGLLQRRRGVGLFVALLTDNNKTLQSKAAFDSLMSEAAAAAIQMGIELPQAIETLTQHYTKIQSKKEI
jgi:GntR family transcriptional regulator